MLEIDILRNYPSIFWRVLRGDLLGFWVTKTMLACVVKDIHLIHMDSDPIKPEFLKIR